MMTNEKKFRKHVLHAVGAYKTLLDQHCANGAPTDRLSAQFGIGRNVLQQGFKDLYGIGIREYKLKQRMERARRLLEAGKEVQHVARDLQYTKARAFSTAFKKYFGVTPTSLSYYIDDL